MDEVLCLVEGCASVPDDELTLDSRGLRLVFAACSEHAQDIRWGAVLPPSTELAGRGLIGPA
ncbi:MAG: hypothetical protein JWR01_2812 [Subtercola sp.]|nr:hypothetical protein [Subtercola sp.]